jgi:hypothetical protein
VRGAHRQRKLDRIWPDAHGLDEEIDLIVDDFRERQFDPIQ